MVARMPALALVSRLRSIVPARRPAEVSSPGEPSRARGLLRRPARRPGLLRAVIMRFATVAALALGAYLLVPLGVALVTNHLRSLDFERAVHSDGSRARIKTERAVPDGSVALIVRDEGGRIRRVVAGQAEADRFVNDRILALDEARARLKAEARRGVDRALESAFADRNESVERFADWFFSWSRSYRLLAESLVSAAARVFEPGDTEPLRVAVERDVAAYLMRHYKAQVLRPEFRDPLVAKGFEAAALGAHDGFRGTVAAQNEALQLFLARHTRHLEDLDGGLTETKLDWDAQRWKAPVHLMEGRSFDGAIGLGWAGAGGVIGAATLGPAIDAVLARAFAGVGTRVAAQVASRVALAEGGAAAGSVVPGGGTVVGAAIGVALGFGTDYVVSRIRARDERPEFVAANRMALDSTIAAWRGLLAASLDQAIDTWFDDARAALLQTRADATR
jgi:hypothetical protein